MCRLETVLTSGVIARELVASLALRVATQR